jgi:hypothetical protein
MESCDLKRGLVVVVLQWASHSVMSLQHRPSTITSVYSRRERGNYLWMYETVPTSSAVLV